MRVVFMGTPDFSVPVLTEIVGQGHEVCCVYTRAPQPAGRGMDLRPSPVHKVAERFGIPVRTPKSLRNPEEQAAFAALDADCAVVVAYGLILPKPILDAPKLGCFNLHASLLPAYRGAAPINWAIIRGEKETGLTTFLLQHEIDTGDMLFQEKLPIGENETAGELHDRMMLAGAQLVLRTVQAIEKGTVQPQPQADVEATHAPKIFKETCAIDFNQSTAQVHDFIRGLSPYPGAWTMLDGKTLKITRTEQFDIGYLPADRQVGDLKSEELPAPGTFVSDGKNFLRISTADGFVEVLELQLEGKRRMSVRDFLNGFKFDWPFKSANPK